jgi:ribosomal protein S12 methylthiotransferase
MLKSNIPVPAKLPSVDAPVGPPAADKSPKVGFVSLGCPKNLVDSEVMMGLVHNAGAQITARAEDADIIVVNTCSFIDAAKRESVETILEMAQHKARGRARKLIVAGCLVERYRDEIRKNIPEVDAVVGTGELQGILAASGIPAPARPEPSTPFNILSSRPEAEARAPQDRYSRRQWDGAIADLPNYLYDEQTPRLLATAPHSAYIKIA